MAEVSVSGLIKIQIILSIGVSKELTPIFLLILRAKVLAPECLYAKKGIPLTDLELVERLLQVIELSTQDRLDMSGQIKRLEKHILEKYGEIYDSYSE